MASFSFNPNTTLAPIHWQAYLVGAFLIFLCLFTIIGNILVIWTIFREETLHTSKYYYTASLALADLFVGLLVMPLAFLFQMTDDEYWIFSKKLEFFCDLWHSIDIFASTASIFGLLAIGIDRYVAVTRPMAYPNSFICKRWLSIVCVMWICSALLSFPAAIHLKTERIHSHTLSTSNETTKIPSRECHFPTNPYYILFSSIASFYLPLLLMIYVYYCIYSVAKKELQAHHAGYKHQPSRNILKASFRLFNRTKTVTQKSDNLVIDHRSSVEIITLRIHHGSYQQPNNDLSNPDNEDISQEKKFWKKFSKNQKAKTFVGIVMGAFVLCWLPYFTYLLASTVFLFRFRNETHHNLVFQILSWLGYVNSALDILVYVYTSKELRMTLVRLFWRP